MGTMHVVTQVGGGACNDGKPGVPWWRTQALEMCRVIVSTIHSWGPRVGFLTWEINVIVTMTPILKGLGEY